RLPAEARGVAVSPRTGARDGLARPALLVFAVALAIRLYGIDWDQGHFFHPDERAIAEAIQRLSFRPLRLNPHFFPYGSLPMYVTKAATSVLALIQPWFASYDGAIRVGRGLSAFWGSATVLLLV